jgi:hypothetical protein
MQNQKLSFNKISCELIVLPELAGISDYISFCYLIQMINP